MLENYTSGVFVSKSLLPPSPLQRWNTNFEWSRGKKTEVFENFNFYLDYIGQDYLFLFEFPHPFNVQAQWINLILSYVEETLVPFVSGQSTAPSSALELDSLPVSDGELLYTEDGASEQVVLHRRYAMGWMILNILVVIIVLSGKFQLIILLCAKPSETSDVISPYLTRGSVCWMFAKRRTFL